MSGRGALWLAGLAAAAGVGGFLAYRALQAPDPVAVPVPVERRAAVPALRPVFTLTDAAGQPRSITEWDGRPLVINFWATWCPPCRREIPLLNQLAATHGAEGFAVIGVAVDFREDVLAYMKDTPIEYPVLIGEQDGLDAARAFGMDTMGFPWTAFTDRQGRIVTIHVGELHADQAEVLFAAVRAVDAGQLSLEAARAQIEAGLARLRAAKG